MITKKIQSTVLTETYKHGISKDLLSNEKEIKCNNIKKLKKKKKKKKRFDDAIKEKTKGHDPSSQLLIEFIYMLKT